MDILYQFIRDKKRRPMVTVCYLVDNNGGRLFSYGACVCSRKEQPNMKFGRKLSLARAEKALADNKSWGDLAPQAIRVIFGVKRIGLIEADETDFSKKIKALKHRLCSLQKGWSSSC